jgi:hypothetical protein
MSISPNDRHFSINRDPFIGNVRALHSAIRAVKDRAKTHLAEEHQKRASSSAPNLTMKHRIHINGYGPLRLWMSRLKRGETGEELSQSCGVDQRGPQTKF